MKNGLKLHEWQKGQKEKEEEKPWVTPQSCHVCGKVIAGAYGHTTLQEVVWSCSATCEKEVAKLRSLYYGGHHDSIPRASQEEDGRDKNR